VANQGRAVGPTDDVTRRVERALSGPVARALKKKRPLPKAALEDVQLGAIKHPDPKMRRWCLFLLDHYANDESMAVFAEALNDGVAVVRDAALHSIACEPCKDGELCVTDVVPLVIDLLESDPQAELRLKAARTLLGLAARDERAQAALERAGERDPDAVVRSCAREAARGRLVVPKKRYERHQRRHASAHR
jgi:hypothetical protein